MLWVPETDRFAADGDAALSEQIFNEWSGIPAVAEIEAIVKPNGVIGGPNLNELSAPIHNSRPDPMPL